MCQMCINTVDKTENRKSPGIGDETWQGHAIEIKTKSMNGSRGGKTKQNEDHNEEKEKKRENKSIYK